MEAIVLQDQSGRKNNGVYIDVFVEDIGRTEKALIDGGATKSFVSTNFVEKYQLPYNLLEDSEFVIDPGINYAGGN